MKYAKEFILLFGVLVASRLVGLPANFTPLLAMAVFAPKMNVGVWLPLSVLAVTDIILGVYNIMPLVYVMMIIAYYTSSAIRNTYIAGASSVLLWHIIINGAVVIAGPGFAPFTPEAILFDLRLLVSTLAFTALFNLTQRLTQKNEAEVY